MPNEATAASLQGPWSFSGEVSERVRSYLVLLVQTRERDIATLVVLPQAWPATLLFGDVPWRVRTRNCLRKAGLDERLTDLSRITFGDLFRIRGMGAGSILDFACTLEASLGYVFTPIPKAAEAATENQAEISQALLDVLDEPWSDWVSEGDPRFSDLLPPGRGTVTERIDELTSSPDASSARLEALANSMVFVRKKIEDISRLPLDTAMREYLRGLSGQDGDRLEALMRRLQWDGSARRHKGEEAATLLGVSRQRIQQLEAKAVKNRPVHPVFMPALDKALDVLAVKVPIAADAAARLLRDEQLSTVPFHPSSLLKVAEACRHNSPIKLERVFDKEMVVALPERNFSAKVLQVAQRQATQAAASNVTRVAERLRADGIEISEEDVERLLRLYDGIEFLDGGWFWFPDRPNDAVRNISRKMLSVTTPLAVSILREGIKRAFRFRQSSAPRLRSMPLPPPREILTAYYRAHPDFVLHEDGTVRSVLPLDYRIELGPTEQVMVTVIRGSPAGVMDRQSFGDACVERGVNPNTLWTMATYSSVMEHLGTSLWTLCGTIVDPAAVEALRRENALRPREKRIVDHGWTPDGLLWVAMRVPSVNDSMVFYIPTAVQRYLAGRDFPAVTEDGVPCGTIRVYLGGNSGGYPPFLRSQGADEGDILLARFSLPNSSVVLSIIDDDALEELSPAV